MGELDAEMKCGGGFLGSNYQQGSSVQTTASELIVGKY